ncbi:Tam3-transposase (Ac family) protein [Dioscorea alata]|uniref:Tam3-transposase (Ac family) protein n=1 Tax=Dioscorea alata TaxID=55571 RepID=A0ACB7V1U1_DIOAL|nr:Tam3-transposase (Ac family) protein [Dioscorea alata]
MSTGSTNNLNQSQPDWSAESPTPDPVPNSADSGGGESKKRGPYKKRSLVWPHFKERYEGKLRYGECIYCEKRIAADGRTNGTTSLRNHITRCAKNPNNKNNNQATLCVRETENENGQTRTALLSWKFDAELIRKKIAYMVIVDELPFKHVEGIGFKEVMHAACPQFRMPSRWTVTRDCYELYLDERKKLKNLLRHNTSKICLTTDSWTSIQKINYMCLTAHFIDNDWNLNKKVLSFCPISSHKGVDIGQAIEKCLLEWGIDDVFTITVDNASSNDTVVSYLREKFVNWGKCVLEGKWLHVRCVAHIINLVVNDGLKKIGNSIDCIRAAVRYVRQSPARLKKFRECAAVEKIESQKHLCLDCPTRWNSTYLMLDVAQTYERAFDRFALEDPYMIQDIDSIPTTTDWRKARYLNQFLENFYELTLKVFGSKYVTCNTFFQDISGMNAVLTNMMENDNHEVAAMATRMKEKYDKYWGKIEKMNMLVFVAPILDPRIKFEYVEFVLLKMYGQHDGTNVAALAKYALVQLFSEYKKLNSPLEANSQASSSKSGAIEKDALSIDMDAGKRIQDMYKEEFKKRKIEAGGRDSKTELDKYLSEDCEDEEDDFRILSWWKINSHRFPVLSKLARDVLVVPVSTVASKAAFSTGGRVLDPFRSSLTPRIV